MPRLSSRLQLLASQLLPKLPVWDFCCDHGYLGLFAALNGQHPEVHFVDQVPSIIKKLEVDCQEGRYPLPENTQCFFWSQPGESISVPVTGTVVIAGVGAFPLMRILEVLQTRGFLQAQRLILSPHNSEEKLLASLDKGTGVFLDFYRLKTILSALENSRSRQVWVFDRL
jgi:tRNA (adenine22-N1)-methyltransferase